ncbi:MAG TPA: alcohol dehydrogenase catalytic domain-containing protein [Spirochaetota bacterium]|nr:alcohol dehydrogenase catalytic domain-containing protein [Spirochaetota bacterium]HPL15343.1 alcohol dehydrogenase catalytic domain-containing protein [Spirochaetota bacterium]HQF07226.1 alcohol dehydrogenase catalytic domain-containing protein [Spirochaetota bacterium]HQH96126.1 alcohol dehydrogenase catalytic domain-containing protein [Spirochaetota bacterium]HQJ69302.1 alcohol dehydrogenase catalytic domain-containing protein [Spirochaetota bacterium]
MKALMLNLNPLRFAALQALRPLSEKFCFRGPFSTIRLVDIPEPELPGPEWVKIKTRLCGLCGSDINLMFAKDSPSASPFTSFPCVPGHEFCGDIVETGSAVKSVKKGDMVTVIPVLNCETRGIRPVCRSCAAGVPGNCENFAEGAFAPGMFTGICRDINGGFAEYVVAHRSQVVPVPKGVSPESATLTEPFAVGLQAALDNLPGTNDRVLVVGGGVIGAMTVKAIRALGIACDITVAEPSPFAADYVKKSGADRTVGGSLIDAAVEVAGGRAYKPDLGERIVMGGFDRVFDTVGHRDTLNLSLRVLAVKGTLSVLGIGGNVKLDLTPLWLKLQTIKGCYAYRYNTIKGVKRQAFEIALNLIAGKKARVEDMLTHRFSIDEYRKMIEVNVRKSLYKAIKTAVEF